MPAEWTDAEIESLSAYIDGQLEESDRTALEARLANDADLRQELAVMRQTAALLRDLPTIRAPRAFTLTPDMVGQTAVPAAKIAEIRVLPVQKPRSARPIWWIPAASAAGVVLVAGAFFLTQTSNAPNLSSGAPQGVAQVATATIITEFSELNTVVQQPVIQTESLGAASEIARAEDLDDEANKTANEALDTEASDSTQTMTELESLPAAPVAPPDAQTEIQQARTLSSPTVELMDAMVLPMSTQMPSASPDPKMLQSTGEADTMFTGAAGGAAGDQEAIADMEGLNSDPNAPGFTVATVSPIQGTVIAQYNAPVMDMAEMVAETPVIASSMMQESPIPQAVEIGNDPIWVRWFNLLSGWVQRLLGQ